MFKNLLSMVLGDPNKKEITGLTPLVEEVNSLEEATKAKSDAELQEMIASFRRHIIEETEESRHSLQDLRAQYDVTLGDERRELKLQIERDEKDLLKLEEDLMAEVQAQVFAAVREASHRSIGLRHYDVQIVGGALLHQGKVVEMKTGEGKTLVATTSVVLNALAGRGAHVITVNDYLAKRDAQWMGPIYHLLGLTVGVIQSAGNLGVDQASYIYDPAYQSSDDRYQFLRPVTRRDAYHCDITYGTNNEYGFDYLRDNMVYSVDRLTQRELHYAIVDEVDNILIDEARTPLIISGQAEESSEFYKKFAQLVRPLSRSSENSVLDKEPDGDYVLDEKMRVVTLTEQGIERIEQALGVDNLYASENSEMTPYMDNALRANVLFKRDKEYIVKDGEIIIVDEHTGRLMYGRRYSEGLHQAIEAKEGVHVQNESLTLATITFQNFFRMYHKLAGMTGTAQTEGEEFNKIYKLDVTVLPTNVEYLAQQGYYVTEQHKDNGAEIVTYRNPETGEVRHKRIDYADLVYKNQKAKFKAVSEEIREKHSAGQPVLVGTIAIETSELLSRLLEREGIRHQVLNAKQHEREASIIAQAGRLGAVTIATNMAGRGVDILLGGNADGLARDEIRKKGQDLTEVEPEAWQEELRKATAVCEQERVKVLELGGLHVLGTERHDARRIDNQLRGRSGRQGDPGSSRFYVSLEDELMRRFGGLNVAGLMDRLGVDDDIPIEANLVSKSIENAQTKVEGFNFDIRKHLLEYDDVINQQREVIYDQRRRILTTNVKPTVLEMITSELSSLVHSFTASEDSDEWDLEVLGKEVRKMLPLPPTYTTSTWKEMNRGEIEDELLELAEKLYEEKEASIGAEIMRQIERHVMLRVVDNHWIRHLTDLDLLREGIGLRAYGQQDPLVSYKKEAHDMYSQLLEDIQHEIAYTIYHMEVARQPQPVRQMQAVHASGAGSEKTHQAAHKSNLPSRNDPCWCGSGKKYKQCHMRQDLAAGGRPAAAGTPQPGDGRKRSAEASAKRK